MVSPSTQRSSELPVLALVAARAARAAGRAIMDVYARDFTVDYKNDQSPLTDADRASHDTLMESLRETGIPVLSEESENVPYDERRAWPSMWLVDPLDGTKEFVKRNGDFTVNIALIEAGRPVLGVVYVPAHEDLYIGVVGLGAYRGCVSVPRSLEVHGGDPFHRWRNAPDFFQSLESLTNLPQTRHEPSSRGGDERASWDTLGAGIPGVGREPGIDGVIRVVVSRSHGNAETDAFIRCLERDGRPVERVSRGSALKVCMVASGDAHLYPRLAPTMEWDTAAAQAVVECAGGSVVVYDEALHAAYVQRGPSALFSGHSLTYNRPDLLNPCFVAIHPRWDTL